MHPLHECVLRVPDSVRRDVTAFREVVGRYISAELDETRFRARRVPMGVYEQRTGGFMVRVRIGAGVALPAQVRAIAAVSRRFGKAHVTTRQDIQLHDVPIEAVPDVFDELLLANLTSRGGGGNTVRNVSASPRAGVHPDEAFDVRPFAIAAAEYLLDFPSAYNLPRKFKLAFSGTSADDAFASVADVGFFAHARDGVRGFRVFAGGGLGGNPRTGVLVDDWVPAESVHLVSEALRRVFDRHGDRSNKHAARLRFVLERFGEDGFREAYLREKESVASEGLPGTPPRARPFPSPWRPEFASKARPLPSEASSPAVVPEARNGFYSVHINPRYGIIGADALERIANLAEQSAEGLVRTTQQQELLLCGVPGGLVTGVLSALRELGRETFDEHRHSVVACAGAATCRLGLCLSRRLSEAIQERLGDTTRRSVPPVRVSGCPNSCGNHQVAPLGFAGKARRVHGRLMPYYDVFVGGSAREGDARLARPVASIPARSVPGFVAEVQGQGALEPGPLRAIAERYETLPETVPEEYFRDWGADGPFSLAGRGPGECGAGTLDIIRVDLETARGQLAAARRAEDTAASNRALYEATCAAARALLPVFGLEPGTNREVFRDFTGRLVAPGWVGRDSQALVDAAQDWRAGDRKSLQDMDHTVSVLVDRVDELFRSLDGSLRFRLDPLAAPVTASAERPAPGSEEKDLRGVACPLNFVKAKVALESMPVGAELVLLLDEGEPAANVPASFREQGQEVLAQDSEAGHVRVCVRRVK